MRAFNLLPKEEVREQQERGNPLPYILVALAGVLVFAALAAFYLMAGTDVTKKKSEADDLRAELAVYQQNAQQDTLDNKESELATERVTRTASLAAALGSRLAWDRLLREIALVVPDEVSLSQIQGNAPLAASTTTAADGSAVNDLTIVDSTANEASVAEFMARLSVISQLESVRLKEAGESPADPEKVVFTITATFRRAA
jgi:Tfp pilus assembly protein PilN